MKEAGFNVVNLGVLVSQKEFVEAALETAADAVLVSSLTGMRKSIARLRERLLSGYWYIRLYIGGYLVVEISHGKKLGPSLRP